MNKTFIADTLHRSVFGAAWHGSSLRELLADVSWDTAAKLPANGGHSIWEIALHMVAWMEEVSSRLEGNVAQMPQRGDWSQPNEQSASAWEATRQAVEAAMYALLRALEAFPESRLYEYLEAPVIDAPLGAGYTVATMLLGIAQHNAYHGGQIALLKKS